MSRECSVHVITKPHACLRQTRLSISPLFFFVVGYSILKDLWHTCWREDSTGDVMTIDQ